MTRKNTSTSRKPTTKVHPRIVLEDNGRINWDVIVPLVVRVEINPDCTTPGFDRTEALTIASKHVMDRLSDLEGIDLRDVANVDQAAPALCTWNDRLAKQALTWEKALDRNHLLDNPPKPEPPKATPSKSSPEEPETVPVRKTTRKTVRGSKASGGTKSGTKSGTPAKKTPAKRSVKKKTTKRR